MLQIITSKYVCLVQIEKLYNWNFSFGIKDKEFIVEGDHAKVNLRGVDSLWGDCMFIPADWGSE